jgi:hypothetical protein
MTRDTPSSDEMIRRAKETLHLEKDDFLPKVGEELASMGVSIRDVSFPTDDEMPGEQRSTRASVGAGSPNAPTPQPLRTRRVAHSGQDSLVVPSRSVGTVSVPVPPSPAASGSLTGSGVWLRVLGGVLLGFVAVIWVLLLIGAIDNPDDLGAAIGGGAITTLVPFVLGLVFLRAGKRRATMA